MADHVWNCPKLTTSCITMDCSLVIQKKPYWVEALQKSNLLLHFILDLRSFLKNLPLKNLQRPPWPSSKIFWLKHCSFCVTFELFLSHFMGDFCSWYFIWLLYWDHLKHFRSILGQGLCGVFLGWVLYSLIQHFYGGVWMGELDIYILGFTCICPIASDKESIKSQQYIIDQIHFNPFQWLTAQSHFVAGSLPFFPRYRNDAFAHDWLRKHISSHNCGLFCEVWSVQLAFILVQGCK